MPKSHKNKFIFGALIAVNAIFSAALFAHAQNVDSQVSVTPCTSNCFQFEFPTDKNLPNLIFLDPVGDYIFVNFNYNLQDQISISDLRTAFDVPPSASEWEVRLNATNLIANSDPTKFIPYQDIGILAFNNHPTNSVDNSFDDSSVISPINTTIIPGSPATKPFAQSELEALTNDPVPANIEDYYSFFTGINAQSDSKLIMLAPPANQRLGSFSFGIGLIIKTPANPELTLTFDDYSLNLIFTVIL